MPPPDDTHTRLLAVADRLSRLRPDWRSAEKFYEERSELRAELRALANGPTAVRTVTKFVRIAPEPKLETPAEAPAVSQPETPSHLEASEKSDEIAPAAVPIPPPGSLPLILNKHEREVLKRATTVITRGGFASSLRRWNQMVDPNSGVLVLPPMDIARVWDWGSRPWKGGAQSYCRRVFWRSLGLLFASLGMSPETGDVVAKPNPSRRFSKKDQPQNLADTPSQEAPEGDDVPCG